MQGTPGWGLRDGKLHRTFEFADFAQAMVFVNKMARVAEELGHHPDFSVHYNRVEVTIWTHDTNSVTETDHMLAARITGLT